MRAQRRRRALDDAPGVGRVLRVLDLRQVLDAAHRERQRALAAARARDLLLDALLEVGGVGQPGLLVEVPEAARVGVEERVGDRALEIGHELREELEVLVAEAAGGEAVGGDLVVDGERAAHAAVAAAAARRSASARETGPSRSVGCSATSRTSSAVRRLMASTEARLSSRNSCCWRRPSAEPK